LEEVFAAAEGEGNLTSPKQSCYKGSAEVNPFSGTKGD
jgi:hypothetical protein